MAKTLQDFAEELHGTHKHIGEGLLTPFSNQVDAVRMQMFDAHINQTIQLIEADRPKIFTGFENQIGKYSSGYIKLPEGEDIEVKKIFSKNDLNRVYIVYNHAKKEYDLLERREAYNLTEEFGCKIDNTFLDSLEEGRILNGDIIERDMNYDHDMNLKYGKNLNAMFYAYKGFTNEDGIVISQSTAEKMSSPFIKKIVVRLNTNDIPLNMYGTKDTYKAFPNIGEYLNEESILMSFRRINYSEIVNKFTNDLMTKTIDGDTTYFSEYGGRVIDINIWSNNKKDSLKDNVYTRQIADLQESLNVHYDDLILYLESLVEGNNIRTLFSPKLLKFYNKIKEYRDPITEFEEDGKRFDNIVMEFLIETIKPLNRGSKITGRYGNKGVVSHIIPDEDMPRLIEVDGEDVRADTKVNLQADIILNPFGVSNRLNPGQLVEIELNYTTKIIRYRLEGMTSLKEKEDLFFDFLKYTDTHGENHDTYRSLYDTLSENEKEDFFQEVIEHSIELKAEPFWNNINSFDLFDNIYKRFNIEPYRNDKTLNKAPVGEIYMLRLKHEPYDKTSARSVDSNNKSGTPTRTQDSKNNTSKLNNNPIRIGEMEVNNLGLIGSFEHVKELLDRYSNIVNERKDTIKSLLTSNPLDLKFDKRKHFEGNNIKIFKSLLKGLGIEITINERTYLDDISDLSSDEVIALGAYLEANSITSIDEDTWQGTRELLKNLVQTVEDKE